VRLLILCPQLGSVCYLKKIHTIIPFTSIGYGWPGETTVYLDLDDPFPLTPDKEARLIPLLRVMPADMSGHPAKMKWTCRCTAMVMAACNLDSNTSHSCDRCENSQAAIQEHHGPPRSQSIWVTFVLLGHPLTVYMSL
jgi:hypothetical protein